MFKIDNNNLEVVAFSHYALAYGSRSYLLVPRRVGFVVVQTQWTAVSTIVSSNNPSAFPMVSLKIVQPSGVARPGLLE
jgi:hypothetical protein